MMIIAILCHFYLIVLILCFGHEISSEKMEFYHKWLQFLLILIPLDLVHKLNSGFFLDGKIVKDRAKILKRYMKTHFFWDFASYLVLAIEACIAFFVENEVNSYVNMVKMLFFLRYPILRSLIENVEEISNFDHKIEAILSIFKLFVKLLFFAHIVACLWFAISAVNSKEINWLNSKKYEDSTASFKYVVSLYWAITTITTVGYGDITPQNEVEYVFSLVVMVMGSLFFGYSLTFIATIFDKIHKEEISKKSRDFRFFYKRISKLFAFF